ncbi:MAG TPA: sulfurtransferase TusA family protein, partial [Enterovirga sp.]
ASGWGKIHRGTGRAHAAILPVRAPVSEHHLDLRGLKCPLPAMKTGKVLAKLPPGAVLTVVCTDPMSRIDIPNLVRETGDVLDDHAAGEGAFTFRIRRSG